MRRVCRLDGVAFDVHILAEPKGSSASTHLAGMGEQTRGWLAAAQHPGPVRGMSCSARSVPVPDDAVPLLLSDLRAFHIRTLPGMLASQGIGAQLIAEMRERLCAHFTLLGQLLRNPAEVNPGKGEGTRPKSTRAPVALLNYGGEWAGTSYVRLIETVLRTCHVPVARVVLLHYNLGAILPSETQRKQTFASENAERHWRPLLSWFEQHRAATSSATSVPPPTLRQAYWNRYVESTLTQANADPAIRRHAQTYGVCNHSSKPLRARLEMSLERRPTEKFLLLGGRAGAWRGLVMLELVRRGLLRPGTGRWSAGLFRFCGSEESRRQIASVLEPPEPNGSLVDSFCAQLPNILDIDPNQKSGQLEMGSPHEVWRGTRFGVTFETAMETVSGVDSFVFLTEKPLKPLFNLRPFVMLGSAGTLATLRALGFRTFAPTLNETYDDILDASQRTRAVLEEVGRLSTLPASGWKPLLSTLAHNQRHLLCGGLHRVLSQHALYAVRLALEVSRTELYDGHGLSSSAASQPLNRRGQAQAPSPQSQNSRKAARTPAAAKQK